MTPQSREKTMTQGERLIRIETLLEERVIHDLGTMSKDLKGLKKVVEDDIADLAKLKNRGAGILIGVGLIGTIFGVTVASLWKNILALFH